MLINNSSILQGLNMKVIIVLLMSISSFSAVWENENNWNLDWEKKYRQWVLEDFKSDIYSKGKYKGIITDCADAVYAMRAIFAFENKLPFVISNTLGGRSTTLHNETTAFDDIEDDKDRLKAFINNLGHIVGTLSLAHHDTFPVNVNHISPGDSYVTVNPDSSRHAYIIKGILETGYFDLLSSTVPRGVRNLLRKFGSPTPLFSETPFGFRRFKWPEHLDSIEPEISEELGYGLDQYEILERYGSGFFNQVTRIIRQRSETIKNEIERVLKNVENQLKSRVEIVKESIKYQEEIEGRCMSAAEYDSYSTPSRDKRIINALDQLGQSWIKAKDAGNAFAVGEDERLGLDYLILENTSEEAGKKLEGMLKVKFRKGIFKKPKKIDLKRFYFGLKDGTISTNPNDALLYRWGFVDKDVPKSTCENF